MCVWGGGDVESKSLSHRFMNKQTGWQNVCVCRVTVRGNTHTHTPGPPLPPGVGSSHTHLAAAEFTPQL